MWQVSTGGLQPYTPPNSSLTGPHGCSVVFFDIIHQIVNNPVPDSCEQANIALNASFEHMIRSTVIELAKALNRGAMPKCDVILQVRVRKYAAGSSLRAAASSLTLKLTSFSSLSKRKYDPEMGTLSSFCSWFSQPLWNRMIYTMFSIHCFVHPTIKCKTRIMLTTAC